MKKRTLASRANTTRVSDIESLRTEFARLQNNFQEFRGQLAKRMESYARNCDELFHSVYELEIASLRQQVTEEKSHYLGVLERFREVVHKLLPREATILVASEGDELLTKLYGRCVRHFPPDEKGARADSPPPDTASILTLLNDLRAKGGDYLVFPPPPFSLLDRYNGLKRQLERRYRLIHRSDEGGFFFSLNEQSPWLELNELIGKFKAKHKAFPAILDWESETSLRSNFPECAVFTPVGNGEKELPYVNESIDMVAVRGDEACRLKEARRVASEAVLIVSSGNRDRSTFQITIECR